METGEGIKIENEDYNTRMTLTETSWKNTGVYTLKAVNDSGVDEATVEITVLGKLPVKLLNWTSTKDIDEMDQRHG